MELEGGGILVLPCRSKSRGFEAKADVRNQGSNNGPSECESYGHGRARAHMKFEWDSARIVKVSGPEGWQI